MCALAVAEIAINVVIMAVMLLKGYTVWAMVGAAAISATSMAVANGLRVLYIAPDLVTSLERPSVAGIRPLLRGGVGAWLSSFGWMLLSASNNIVISYLGHPEWVPVFSCTAKMSLLLTQLAWVMPDSGLVGLAQLQGEQPRSNRVKQMVGALVQLHLLMAGGAACVVLAFNPVFVGRWVGEPFFGGMGLNALLAAGVLVYGLIHGLVTAAAVVGDRLRVGVISLVNGVVQCACAILFGGIWGLSGVAAAGLLAGLVTAVPASLVPLRGRLGLDAHAGERYRGPLGRASGALAGGGRIRWRRAPDFGSGAERGGGYRNRARLSLADASAVSHSAD